jgi:hypothetical protein
MTTCDKCGKEVTIGEWPFCPHGIPSKATTAPDHAYFDIGLGKYIRNQGERWREMKRQNVQYNS